MIVADNILAAYHERAKGNYAAWETANPDKAKLLHSALVSAIELGYIPKME